MNLTYNALCAALVLLVMLTQPTRAQDIQIFEDWRVSCEAPEPCRMAQAIVQPSTRRLILQVKIFKGEKPTALITFPLGILLNTGWQYQIDGNPAKVVPFEICNTEGCHAGLELTPALLSAMKRGSQMKIRFFDAAKTEVDPKISLIGFTKAYGALK